ncbi:MAG: filamentous hemagglutinin N-terminal domain-containing protein [Pseudohongiellaceae bacterium]
MNRSRPRKLVQAIAVALSSQLSSQAQSQTLPDGMQVDQGTATLASPGAAQLDINQTSSRAVLRWNQFDIDSGGTVRFQQPDNQSATLNIVDSATSSTLSGELRATGSVYLINPHGVTITPTGSVDTGGAFIASSLGMDSAEFMNGANPLTFNGDSGLVRNAGSITARDVLLLGNRAENAGQITAATGRVALGSASRATLDLSGDGFLQVLAPATVSGSDALVSNTGTITADGGLVQLKASTVRSALREAIHMPGSVRARSVSGRDGAITFHGGEGGALTVSGSIETRQEAGHPDGGQVALTGATLDADLDAMTIGARGTLDIGVNNLRVLESGSTSGNDTVLTESFSDSNVGRLLRNGTNLVLRANNDIEWPWGMVILQNELAAEADGKAGDLTLEAGRSILLGGNFNTASGNWRMTANATPRVDAERQSGDARISVFASSQRANFLNQNSHLTLEIEDGGGRTDRGADTLQLPLGFDGSSLSARIDPGVSGYEEADIQILGDLSANQDITLDGHLRSAGWSQLMVTLSGQQVNWTTETSGGRLTGRELRFIEDGTVTRFGRGAPRFTGPGADAARLQLGSTGTVTRTYGDAEPDQAALGDHLLSESSYNTVPLDDTAMGDILADGSIRANGPGVTAGAGRHTLTLRATDDIAFQDAGGGGDLGSGPGYWIDASGSDSAANQLRLDIARRPLTPTLFDAAYTYDEPEVVASLSGIVNNDDVVPVLAMNGGTVALSAMDGDFALPPRFDAGNYTASLHGLGGTTAANYSLDSTAAGTANIDIARRPLSYTAQATRSTYGDSPDLAAELTGVLSGDYVYVELQLSDESGPVTTSIRTPVGEYQSSVTGLYGREAGNYTLTTVGSTSSTHIIDPRKLSWHVKYLTRTYGSHNPDSLPNAPLTGRVEGDAVHLPLELSEPLPYDADVGNYKLHIGTLQGADRTNYVLATAGNTGGQLRIVPKELTWETAGGESTYGSLPSIGHDQGSHVLRGIVGDDDVSGASYYFDRFGVRANVGSDTPPGTYTVRVERLYGEDIDNYSLATHGNTAGKYVIRRKPVTWSLPSYDIQYGEDLPIDYDNIPTGLHDIMSSDEVEARVRLMYQDDPVLWDDMRLPVGEYEYHVTELSGEDADKYRLVGPRGTPGILHVTPLTVNWTVGDASMVYGDSPEVPQYSIDGVLPGETVTPEVSIRDAAGDIITRPDVGTWSLYIDGFKGPDAGNYQLASTTSGNGRPGEITVRPRPLSYFYNASVDYGDRLSPELSPNNGLLEGDEAPDLSYALTRDGQQVGTYLSTMPFIADEHNRLAVGTYTIQPRTLIASGNEPLNYTLQRHPVSGQIAEGGSIRVEPRELTYEIRLSGVTGDDNSHYAGNAYSVPYLAYRPSDVGDGLRVTTRLDNVLPGDEVTLGTRTPQFPTSTQGYIQAGSSYTWRADSTFGGADGGNYRVSLNGSRNARLTVTPLPVTINASADDREYGDRDDIAITVAPDLEDAREALQQAFADGYVRIGEREVGFKTPDDPGPVAELPYYAPAGTYGLQPLSLSTLLQGPDAANFAPQFRGGDFEIRPRLLTVTARDPELVYGDDFDLDTLFRVEGILNRDDARLATDTFINLRESDEEGWFSRRHGSRINAGEYVAESRSEYLQGADRDNYRLPHVESLLTIQRRELFIDDGLPKTATYGDVNLNPTVTGFLPDGRAEYQAHISQLFDFRFRHGESGEITVGEQPDAGNYQLEAILQEDSDPRVFTNYRPPDPVDLRVFRRYLEARLTGTEHTYGVERQNLMELVLDSPRAGSQPAVVSGDDVSLGFDFRSRPPREYQTDGAMRLPVGTYAIDGLSQHITGADANNYYLRERVDHGAELRIVPKDVTLSNLEAGRQETYGNVIRLADLDGVLPEDELNISGRRNGDNMTAPVTEGRVYDNTTPDVDEYQYELTGLTGPAARNYRLAGSAGTSVTVTPRQLVYAIQNVTGQYGNFKACFDPTYGPACPDSPDVDEDSEPSIYEPLELGNLTLFNFMEGDNIGGQISLVDAEDGTELTLEDRPTPGTYFQVVTGLTGDDVDNYTLAETGSVPGVLTITPKWVDWRTVGGFYTQDTGIVTHGSFDDESSEADPSRSIIRDTARDQGVYPEHIDGVNATVRIFRDGNPDNEWPFQDPANPNEWQNAPAGTWAMVVTGFEGEYADYYRPLPAQSLSTGHLGVMVVNSLGGLGGDELDESVLAARQRQFDRFGEHAPVPDEPLYNDSRSSSPDSGSETGTGPDTVADGTGSSGTDDSSPDGTSDGTSSDNVNTSADGYIDTLANYGVTGVTVQADAGGEVGIEYRFGPGFVSTGAEADASARTRLGYRGLDTRAAVNAGVTAATGASGNVVIGTGSAGAGVGANAGARARSQYTFEDNRLVLKNSALVGAGGSVTGEAGLAGDVGSANVKTTLMSPGNVGAGAGGSAGFEDGELSFDLRMTLAVGVLGGTLNLSGSIDVYAIGEGFEDAGEWVLDAAHGFCQGFGGCSDPTPHELYMAQQELAYTQRVGGSPTERYQLLTSAPEQFMEIQNTPTGEQREWMDDNRDFVREFSVLEEELEAFYERQAAYRETFQEAMATGDSRTATRMVREMAVEDSPGSVVERLGQRAADLGVELQMVDGMLRIVDDETPTPERPSVQ